MSFLKSLRSKRMSFGREMLIIPLALFVSIFIYCVAVAVASEPMSLLDFVLLAPDTTEKIFNYYSASLRAPLFTGFLTLGGFLMSAKTFIIVNMKKEVYDTPSYELEWEDGLKLDGPRRYKTLYHPLKRLSNVILWTISSSFFASVSQLTLGLIPTMLTVMVCLFLVVTTVMFLMLALYLIKKNLSVMFDHLDKKSKAILDDEKAKESSK